MGTLLILLSPQVSWVLWIEALTFTGLATPCNVMLSADFLGCRLSHHSGCWFKEKKKQIKKIGNNFKSTIWTPILTSLVFWSLQAAKWMLTHLLLLFDLGRMPSFQPNSLLFPSVLLSFQTMLCEIVPKNLTEIWFHEIHSFSLSYLSSHIIKVGSQVGQV